jgi:hypothetical protein
MSRAELIFRDIKEIRISKGFYGASSKCYTRNILIFDGDDCFEITLHSGQFIKDIPVNLTEEELVI